MEVGGGFFWDGGAKITLKEFRTADGKTQLEYSKSKDLFSKTYFCSRLTGFFIYSQLYGDSPTSRVKRIPAQDHAMETNRSFELPSSIAAL